MQCISLQTGLVTEDGRKTPSHRALLQPARRNGLDDGDALRGDHPQPDRRGVHELAVRRHHGRARREPAWLGRPAGGGAAARGGVRAVGETKGELDSVVFACHSGSCGR